MTSPTLIFSNPIPFIPFPLTRGRGIGYIREASPLFDSPLVSLSFSGKEQNSAFVTLTKEHPIIRVFKRGEALVIASEAKQSLIIAPPSSLEIASPFSGRARNDTELSLRGASEAEAQSAAKGTKQPLTQKG